MIIYSENYIRKGWTRYELLKGLQEYEERKVNIIVINLMRGDKMPDSYFEISKRIPKENQYNTNNINEIIDKILERVKMLLQSKEGEYEQRNIRIYRTYIHAIKEDSAAIFAGAGLSVNSGYVNWKELMRDIAEELGLDVDKETDLIEIAQFYRNSKSGRGSINQKLVDEFTKNVAISENHKLLAKLPIKTFWTTNYDNLIEKTIEQSNKIVDVKLTSDSLLYAKKRRDAVV